MQTCIVLFRGINVGGKNILPMKELVHLLQTLACEKIQTYIQSGNVVFQTMETATEGLADRISERIFAQFGFKPYVLLLTADDLRRAVDNNPFPETGSSLHFYFAGASPTDPDMEKLAALKTETEEFKLFDNLFYLYAPDGIGRSQLAANVEKCLGVPVTGRNFNTISRLMHMAENLVNH